MPNLANSTVRYGEVLSNPIPLEWPDKSSSSFQAGSGAPTIDDDDSRIIVLEQGSNDEETADNRRAFSSDVPDYIDDTFYTVDPFGSPGYDFRGQQKGNEEDEDYGFNFGTVVENEEEEDTMAAKVGPTCTSNVCKRDL